jgi:transcription-repair coupling factor (superfamily II helicase)
MESDRPMDRLVCGDVGFVTEVAIRAFKAVDNGKQVAILVPTYFSLSALPYFYRAIEDMPVTIGYLNRFRSAQKQKLKRFAEGKTRYRHRTHIG